jgi:hypothetical protein
MRVFKERGICRVILETRDIGRVRRRGCQSGWLFRILFCIPICGTLRMGAGAYIEVSMMASKVGLEGTCRKHATPREVGRTPATLLGRRLEASLANIETLQQD